MYITYLPDSHLQHKPWNRLINDPRPHPPVLPYPRPGPVPAGPAPGLFTRPPRPVSRFSLPLPLPLPPPALGVSDKGPALGEGRVIWNPTACTIVSCHSKPGRGEHSTVTRLHSCTTLHCTTTCPATYFRRQAARRRKEQKHRNSNNNERKKQKKKPTQPASQSAQAQSPNLTRNPCVVDLNSGGTERVGRVR
ncbi:hypothetical protein DFP73DRAFT_296655 [Morchella snyderi]|nr:hypothetical protein DFP73DRAFT_296655 [Morchella snyderi]